MDSEVPWEDEKYRPDFAPGGPLANTTLVTVMLAIVSNVCVLLSDENSNRCFDLDAAAQSRTTSAGEDDSPTIERWPTLLLPMLTGVDPHPVYVPGDRHIV